MNNLLAMLAFVVLAAFLSILVIHVPRMDITAIIGLTLALAGWDLYQGLRGNKG